MTETVLQPREGSPLRFPTQRHRQAAESILAFWQGISSEQVAIRLGLPERYTQLPAVLQVPHLEGEGLRTNARHLGTLLETWVQ